MAAKSPEEKNLDAVIRAHDVKVAPALLQIVEPAKEHGIFKFVYEVTPQEHIWWSARRVNMDETRTRYDLRLIPHVG